MVVRDIGQLGVVSQLVNAANIISPNSEAYFCCKISLWLKKDELLVPKMNLSKANSTGIHIVGVTFLRLKGGKGDMERATKQMVYVVKERDQLLLSMEACRDLGIIGPEIPKVRSHGTREVLKLSADDEACQEDCELPCKINSKGDCSCPRSELPQGRPIHELKTLILNHHAASTFSRCTFQPLSSMKGPHLGKM